MENKLKIFYYFLREFRQRFLLFLSFSIALSVTQTVLIACLYPFISFSLEQGSAYENTGFILRHMTEFIQRIPIAQPFVCASLQQGNIWSKYLKRTYRKYYTNPRVLLKNLTTITDWDMVKKYWNFFRMLA